ncbi:6208_t:CDS:2, partial [Entrophospora sp. SA101]
SYRKLRTDFDPALIRPIIFPQGEMILETRRILMTTFDLLEGLRHIWSCRSLLTEDDYSENAYVIHAVSKEKNQDLQILLKLDMKENELVLVEISRSFPEQDKEGLDSKKLVRICKDCFDERYNIFFKKREDTSSKSKLIHCELGKIPVLGSK